MRNNSPDKLIQSVLKLGNLFPSKGQNGNIFSPDGISPTILSGVTDKAGNGGIGSCNAPKIIVLDKFKEKSNGR